MRVLVAVKATEQSESGVMPDDPSMFIEMGKFNDELIAAGVMLDGAGLKASANGKRLTFQGGKATVVDGPFAETKELIAGFWIWQCASLHEAIEWVKRCPNPMLTDSEIEIRQIFSAEDFGEAFTPELQEHDERLRAKLAQQQGKGG